MSSWNTVAELDTYLATRSYVKGYTFSEEDKKAFAKIGSTVRALLISDVRFYDIIYGFGLDDF
jgi:hypothetical protein